MLLLLLFVPWRFCRQFYMWRETFCNAGCVPIRGILYEHLPELLSIRLAVLPTLLLYGGYRPKCPLGALLPRGQLPGLPGPFAQTRLRTGLRLRAQPSRGAY